MGKWNVSDETDIQDTVSVKTTKKSKAKDPDWRARGHDSRYYKKDEIILKTEILNDEYFYGEDD